MTSSCAVATALPMWSRVVVVVAHPDDESFGLGAVIDEFARAGSHVHVVCLTHGEASTLGVDAGDLAQVRRGELVEAARALDIAGFTLLSYPDGGLRDLPEGLLSEAVRRVVEAERPDGLVAFDPDGITGHPDHQAATRAALEVARQHRLPILAWALPDMVSDIMNDELGTAMAGHPLEEMDIALSCRRDAQRVAVRAHSSQHAPGSPLWRRLELLGDTEWLRWLTPDR